MAEYVTTGVMIVVGLFISLSMPFSDILRVGIFHICVRVTGVFLHVAGPHKTNIHTIGCLMVLAALGHTLLNYFILHERMNQFSWSGSILGIVGACIVWLGAGRQTCDLD